MKERYHIPYTLDAHFGDVKTKLITDTGQGIDKEFTVRGLLTTFAAGAFSGMSGKITEINPEKDKLYVSIDMFGRETNAELDYNQVKEFDQ